MESLFRRSLQERLTITIIYESKHGKFSQRTILVLSLNEHSIFAYCLMRQDLRRFSIDHILSALPIRFQQTKRSKRRPAG
jgi:predicted DNA-binding transcriptional regulator YafY